MLEKSVKIYPFDAKELICHLEKKPAVLEKEIVFAGMVVRSVAETDQEKEFQVLRGDANNFQSQNINIGYDGLSAEDIRKKFNHCYANGKRSIIGTMSLPQGSIILMYYKNGKENLEGVLYHAGEAGVRKYLLELAQLKENRKDDIVTESKNNPVAPVRLDEAAEIVALWDQIKKLLEEIKANFPAFLPKVKEELQQLDLRLMELVIPSDKKAVLIESGVEEAEMKSVEVAATCLPKENTIDEAADVKVVSSKSPDKNSAQESATEPKKDSLRGTPHKKIRKKTQVVNQMPVPKDPADQKFHTRISGGKEIRSLISSGKYQEAEFIAMLNKALDSQCDRVGTPINCFVCRTLRGYFAREFRREEMDYASFINNVGQRLYELSSLILVLYNKREEFKRGKFVDFWLKLGAKKEELGFDLQEMQAVVLQLRSLLNALK